MSELGMYFGIAIGCIALLAVSGGIIYRKHRQDARVKVAVEQETQDRLQQVVDLNLPPFYIDHELDPVCIYEHELPPDVLPPVQPIFVHSATDDSMLIPPEDDPLIAHSSAAREVQSPSIASTTNDHPAILFSPAITIDHSETGRSGTSLNAAQVQESYFEPINMPTPPPQAALFSPAMQRPTTPPSVFSSYSIPTVPRSINQEMISLARVRAPPSYDVPNVVVDRSPLYHPSTHISSPYTSYAEDGHSQSDYFGHVRNRAHTFSHPSASSPNQAFLQQLQQHHRQQQQSHQEQQYHQSQEEEDLPQTPRYSLEFPSDVPHELHLEQHQRSRAQYDNSVLIQSPSSFTTITSWDYEQEGIQLRDRLSPSFSTQSQPGSHTSSPLLMFEQTTTFTSPGSNSSSSRRGSRPGLRARASTLGESSKAMVQRMHSLLRNSTSAQSRDSTPASSPRLAAASTLGGGVGSFEGEGSASVPMVGLGLGLEYGGHVAPEQVVPTQEREREHGQFVVVVDEPVEETEDNAAAIVNNPITASTSPSPAAAQFSGPISLRSPHSIESLTHTLSINNVKYEDASEEADNADSDTNDKEEEVSEDESVSKTQHQHPQPLPSAEPMATMPMPLAVS
ncbi:hypothetical protein BGX24_010369 [Mortierella sp. AD032]|nr:hypothetical protein BGX24_010369 [Mortierella sp. AD032]